MAWPNSMLTSYVAGTTPAIKAADLNSLQSGVNGIVNATYSLRSVVIDGTGGSVVVPVAGTARVSSVASGTAVPTTAVPWGTCYRDQVLFGGVRITAGGSLSAGFNVKTINYTAPGQYEVIFHGQPTNTGRLRAEVSSFNNGALAAAGSAVVLDVDSIATSGSDMAVTVIAYDGNATTVPPAIDKINAGFCLEVWGG